MDGAVVDCEVLHSAAHTPRGSWRRRRRRRCGGRLGCDRPPGGIACGSGTQRVAPGSACLAAVQGGCWLPDVVTAVILFGRVGNALLSGPAVDEEPALPPGVRRFAERVRRPALPSSLGAYHLAKRIDYLARAVGARERRCGLGGQERMEYFSRVEVSK